MQHLRVENARRGAHVLYAGRDNSQSINSPSLLSAGKLLTHLHPGVVRDFLGPGKNHCIVAFRGLEEEPISYAAGFDHDSSGIYRGLFLPSDAEWEKALTSGWWAHL